MPLSKRRPSGLTLIQPNSSSPKSSNFYPGRPSRLSRLSFKPPTLNLGPQKPVQTIHQFCENIPKNVPKQINEGCNRILKLDNKEYINLTGKYTIEFNENNIIKTLKKVSDKDNYEITDLTTGETGTGQNILSLLYGKKDKIDVVVKISDLYKTYNNKDYFNAIYKDLELNTNRSKHAVALWGFINSVELQNKAAAPENKIAPEIYDYFIYEKNRTLYSVIVMEKIEGRPINNGDDEEAIKKVLNELHDTGIIHGDINPGNIIKVDGKDGEADKYMLIDFDMAQESQQKNDTGVNTPQQKNDTGVNTLRLSQIFASKVSGKTKKKKNKKRTRKIKRGKKTKYSTVKR